MLLLLFFGFLAGIATTLSPCILPILPIMLSGAVGGKKRPYGIILGFVLSFSVFTLFITAIVQSLGVDLDILRWVAAGILILMGLAMLFPAMMNKLNGLTGKLSSSKAVQNSQSKSGLGGGFLTGLTLGLIWTPCAGPILASVITLAATQQAGFASFLIIMAYSLGTSAIMLLILLGSRKVIEKVRAINKHLDTIHRVFGILIIVAGLGIATGYDRKVQQYILEVTPTEYNEFLQQIEDNEAVQEELEELEQSEEEMDTTELLEHMNEAAQAASSVATNPLFNQNPPIRAPEFTGIESWINSNGETLESLKGKVVLVDFWTYSCINCIRTLPHVTSWYEQYKDEGLVVIGVHTPEFAFEQKRSNVEEAVAEHDIDYPVALDNDFATWQAYSNRYWPAHYFIDKEGRIRHTHFGEGEYDKSEEVIRALLEEDGPEITDATVESAQEENPASFFRRQSPETYLGYARAANLLNATEVQEDRSTAYSAVEGATSNEWTIDGTWTMYDERLESGDDAATLTYVFDAKEVYLVMGADAPAEVEVLLDGSPVPEQYRGEHVKETDGRTVVTVQDETLYRLIQGPSFTTAGELTLKVPAGVALYAFTFGS